MLVSVQFSKVESTCSSYGKINCLIQVRKEENLTNKRCLIFNLGFSRVAVKESFQRPEMMTKEAEPVQQWRNYLDNFVLTRTTTTL